MSDDRERRLDAIRRHADRLQELATRYDRLRCMAERDASNAFLDLAEATGDLAKDRLRELGLLLEILWTAGNKLEPQSVSPRMARLYSMSNFG